VARLLGKSVEEIEKTMSNKEFSRWVAYIHIENPFNRGLK